MSVAAAVNEDMADTRPQSPGRSRQGFAALPPAQRSLAAAIGSLTNWSRRMTPESRRAATEPARQGLRSRWAAQADPGGTLAPYELARAVDLLQRAHRRRMALASAKARARGTP
jgi:hypothetical protein